MLGRNGYVRESCQHLRRLALPRRLGPQKYNSSNSKDSGWHYTNTTYIPGTVVGNLHVLILQDRTWQGRCYHLQKKKAWKGHLNKMMEPEFNPPPYMFFKPSFLCPFPNPWLAPIHSLFSPKFLRGSRGPRCWGDKGERWRFFFGMDSFKFSLWFNFKLTKWLPGGTKNSLSRIIGC